MKKEKRGVKKGTERGSYNKDSKRSIVLLGGNRYSEKEAEEIQRILEKYKEKYPKKRDAILEIFRTAEKNN